MITPPAFLPPPPASLLARRRWLKGTGALLGLAVLAAPAQALAPVAAAGAEAIGTVKLLTGTVVPQGWVLCDGRELAIDQHPALFAVLGPTYGGDGRHTFALPDLRAEMAGMAAAAANRPADAVPLGQLCAIKLASGPAAATAVAELRLHHLRRSRAARG